MHKKDIKTSFHSILIFFFLQEMQMINDVLDDKVVSSVCSCRENEMKKKERKRGREKEQKKAIIVDHVLFPLQVFKIDNMLYASQFIYELIVYRAKGTNMFCNYQT